MLCLVTLSLLNMSGRARLELELYPAGLKVVTY